MPTLGSIDSIRAEFPSLHREVSGRIPIFFDGPAGTQVPQKVAQAIYEAILFHNANRAGKFATSHDVDKILDDAALACCDWVGASDRQEIVFGPNMTTLTFQISRALARQWGPGDEIVVTRLDHDANFTPWVMAAEERGATVRIVEVNREDATLDLDHFARQLSSRTKLVAFTAASNSVGSLTPVKQLADLVHRSGALAFVDAVHFAPHGLIDVQEWGCDFLVCSAYKFFGPHIGILWGKREILERTTAYKVCPAPNSIPGKWMTGTQNHSCIAGVTAAINYIKSLGNGGADGRDCLRKSFEGIIEHERTLIARLIQGLTAISSLQLFGIQDLGRMSERVPTISFRLPGWTSAELAQALGDQGVYTWHGNYYALQLSQFLGCEPDGMLRMGLMHYNTEEEVDRVIDLVDELSRQRP